MARFGLFMATVAMVLAAGLDMAQAGSHRWMSGVTLQAPPPVRRTPLDAMGYAVNNMNHDPATTNETGWNNNMSPTPTTASTLKKRYLIAHRFRRQGWPDRTIPYCYETQEAEDVLSATLARAIALWTDRLGPTYQMVQFAPSGPECIGNPDRARSSYLIISLSHRLNSWIGFGGRAPQMELSTRLDIGARNLTINFAHEIGHVWGLRHEHQDPAFWGGVANGLWLDEPDEAPFQRRGFDCQNLADYQETEVRALAAGRTMEELCSNWAVAGEFEFNAMDWLPIPGAYIQGEADEGEENDDVDWDSIMLYGNTAGGLGFANANTDNRLQVIRRWDPEDEEFKSFGPNRQPSDRDIRGLYEIYNDPRAFDRFSDDEDDDDDGPALPLETTHPQHPVLIQVSQQGLCG